MNIGIYIYDDAEVLDFAGPFEVFSTTQRLVGNDWNIFFVAQTLQMVKARGGFAVYPHFSIKEHPPIDLLIVAGGMHDKQLSKIDVINWINRTSLSASHVASVCTGAFLLAQAELLNGLEVTTHWEDISRLSADYPKLIVQRKRRWVDSGKFITSAGISAGIDMSLHLVAKISGMEHAVKTARQMEFDWRKES